MISLQILDRGYFFLHVCQLTDMLINDSIPFVLVGIYGRYRVNKQITLSANSDT